MIKDRNHNDLIEAMRLKRSSKNTQITIQHSLNDLNNHDGAVTHLESDILKYEVK